MAVCLGRVFRPHRWVCPHVVVVVGFACSMIFETMLVEPLVHDRFKERNQTRRDVQKWLPSGWWHGEVVRTYLCLLRAEAIHKDSLTKKKAHRPNYFRVKCEYTLIELKLLCPFCIIIIKIFALVKDSIKRIVAIIPLILFIQLDVLVPARLINWSYHISG